MKTSGSSMCLCGQRGTRLGSWYFQITLTARWSSMCLLSVGTAVPPRILWCTVMCVSASSRSVTLRLSAGGFQTWTHIVPSGNSVMPQICLPLTLNLELRHFWFKFLKAEPHCTLNCFDLKSSLTLIGCVLCDSEHLGQFSIYQQHILIKIYSAFIICPKTILKHTYKQPQKQSNRKTRQRWSSQWVDLWEDIFEHEENIFLQGWRWVWFSRMQRFHLKTAKTMRVISLDWCQPKN